MYLFIFIYFRSPEDRSLPESWVANCSRYGMCICVQNYTENFPRNQYEQNVIYQKSHATFVHSVTDFVFIFIFSN